MIDTARVRVGGELKYVEISTLACLTNSVETTAGVDRLSAEATRAIAYSRQRAGDISQKNLPSAEKFAIPQIANIEMNATNIARISFTFAGTVEMTRGSMFKRAV